MTSLNKINRKIGKLLIGVLAFVFLFSNSTAFAISLKDYENLHTEFYDDCAVPSEEQPGVTPSKTIKSLYMVGDSITEGARDSYGLRNKFQSKGIKASISATGGSSITYSAAGRSGLEWVEHDKDKISEVDAIVIAHGTNHDPSDFEGPLREIVRKVKNYNNDAVIFWVNTYTKSQLDPNPGGDKPYTAESSDKKNEIINKQSSLLDFSVIDISKKNSETKPLPLADDGIHPAFSEGGHGEWGNRIVEQISKGTATGGVDGAGGFTDEICCPGGGSPDSETTLAGKDNEEKVWNYFKDKGLEDHLVAGIMGNISQESGFDPQNIQDPAGRTKDPSGITSGWGLIQWTPGNKIIGIANEAGIDGPIHELKTQLDIIWWHATEVSPTGLTNILPEFKRATNPKEAASAWEELIEGAGDPQMENRWAAAEAAMEKYGGSGGGGGSSGSGGGGGCACEATGPSGDLSTKLDKLAEDNGGKTRISVSTIKGDIKGDADGNLQMPTRSTYKVYTAYATLKAIEEGRITWSTQTSWGQSVEATMEAMIVISDNDAAYALRTDSRIGNHTKVTALLQNQVGLSNKTVMGSGDTTNSNSQSTANDFTKFLVMLEKNKLPGVTKAGNYNKLLSFMERATTDGGSARAGIVAGVGEGSEVADKAGWAGAGVDQASNDVGIVYLDGNPYVISILTDKPNEWDGVANIAKGVHGMMTGGLAGGGCGVGNGDAISTVLEYAWHDGRKGNEARPEYAQAVRSHPGEYSGGCGGQDCGAFVTRVMRDSGADKDYNEDEGNTVSQKDYMDSHPDKYENLGQKNSTNELQPGDIAITRDTHTFIYVGKQDGFEANAAHASLCSYMPTANNAYFVDANGVPFTWYQLK